MFGDRDRSPACQGSNDLETPARLTFRVTTGDTEARGQVIFPRVTQQVSGRAGDGTHGLGTQRWLGGRLPDWRQPLLTSCGGVKGRASGGVIEFSFPAIKDKGRL